MFGKLLQGFTEEQEKGERRKFESEQIRRKVGAQIIMQLSEQAPPELQGIMGQDALNILSGQEKNFKLDKKLQGYADAFVKQLEQQGQQQQQRPRGDTGVRPISGMQPPPMPPPSFADIVREEQEGRQEAGLQQRVTEAGLTERARQEARLDVLPAPPEEVSKEGQRYKELLDIFGPGGDTQARQIAYGETPREKAAAKDRKVQAESLFLKSQLDAGMTPQKAVESYLKLQQSVQTKGAIDKLKAQSKALAAREMTPGQRALAARTLLNLVKDMSKDPLSGEVDKTTFDQYIRATGYSIEQLLRMAAPTRTLPSPPGGEGAAGKTFTLQQAQRLAKKKNISVEKVIQELTGRGFRLTSGQ